MRYGPRIFREHSEHPLDPLSDILSLLRPRTAVSAGLRAGGDWAIRFPGHEGVKFNAVIHGACWVSVDGAESRRIAAGDCFLLTRGRPFRMATDLSLPEVDSARIYDRASDGIATFQGGQDFFLVGGRFAFDGDHAGLLFGELPAIVHVSRASDQAAVLRWSLAQLATELAEGAPGSRLMGDHLAQIMLLQVLRLWLSGGRGSGWLAALADPRLGRALRAIHGEPARRWTLAELAAAAGMSRTSFAERFRRVVGRTPFDYLARWRMQLAADRLRRSGDSVATIGYAAGYASEGAFSAAFRRTMGCTPSAYRRGAQPEQSCG
ncbi:AraC family transcriptional regulator [Pelagerythrobacter marinus]|uniref:AraC family transcriptional regulator n=1 Tax=Pelagerythrobacter marinus TaxID=538382 RepID=UPI002036754B|nr:AraC family transcriptional regulator [Pelagerythrobacter marinus]USA40817.1 AraC family transcriptional regulator [Pelagerythrobacter marinus]WPZ08009.1 AraC family transcriptional regulator [Pelagerythrobacter marinus]